MNVCMFNARIGPENEKQLRTTPKGTPVTECNVRMTSGKPGYEHGFFIKIGAFGQLARKLADFRHGDEVFVQGEFCVDDFLSKDGKKARKHYFIAQNIELLVPASDIADPQSEPQGEDPDDQRKERDAGDPTNKAVIQPEEIPIFIKEVNDASYPF